MEPASIRCKNPGAMWGRTGRKPTQFFATPQGPHGCETNAPIPVKWGSTKTIYLSDGLGQNNNIAIFDTWVQGICAQLDLWRTSKNYRNKRLADALHTWSGGNNVPSYIALVKARVPGVTENTIMNDAFWRSPSGVAFLKAQAGHEAGKSYPAPDADWTEAQRRVFARVDTAASVKKTGGAIAAGSTAAAAAHQAGFSPSAVVAIGAIAVIVTVISLMFFVKRK
ncbi:hypothetical protein ACQR1I_36220 [Bradyrhizobium sp. HKCCYLS2038]|uniref:hypothetical protein n=1 Tax=Bradyrhizobium sp. HKCCYLS2038 TaxID=3420764 RepID=UPI003EB8AE72